MVLADRRDIVNALYKCILNGPALVACCVCRRLSSLCTECIVAKRCVLEQKLLLTASRNRIWEIDWLQNKWPWPLFRGRIKVMSTIALHSTLNISETVKNRGLVAKDTDRKWPTGNQMVTWEMTRWERWKVKLVTPIRLKRIFRKRLDCWS